MFLNALNQEDKKKFLELLYKIANCDGEYAEEEAEIIRNYQLELGISEIPETATQAELIAYFGEAMETVRKIVLFEIYGLITSDDTIAADERHALHEIADRFRFDQAQVLELETLAEKLRQVYDEIYDAIF